MRVVVTGGSGFVGTHVVRALLERGDDPVVADLRTYPDGAVECVTGDLRDPDVVSAAVRPGTAAIVHLAAATSVLMSMSDPHGVYANNVAVTESLLERAREVGVERFVFASTNAVCGDVGGRVIDEEVPPRPLTPYGATKAAAEMLLSSYAGSYDLPSVALRFTNIYGRGMHVKDSIVARIMRAAMASRPIQVYGDGEQRRDYLYVTDAVQSVLLGLTPGCPELLTIGSERSISVNQLLELAAEAVGSPVAAEHVAARKGEMPIVEVDTSRARGAGFAPRYSLERGLAETWDHFVSGTDETRG